MSPLRRSRAQGGGSRFKTSSAVGRSFDLRHRRIRCLLERVCHSASTTAPATTAAMATVDQHRRTTHRPFVRPSPRARLCLPYDDSHTLGVPCERGPTSRALVDGLLTMAISGRCVVHLSDDAIRRLGSLRYGWMPSPIWVLLSPRTPPGYVTESAICGL
ncbi:hypothetical protein VTI74DRAFT_656 [Chaetomium olivicolor]